MNRLLLSALALAALTLAACGKDDEEDSSSETATLSAAYSEFSDNVTITLEGSDVIIEANGYPNHKSPYWPTDHELYEASADQNFLDNQAPGFITSYVGTTTLTVSANPSQASSTTASSLGAIGIAVSGSVIYNDQEGPNVALEFPTAYSLDWTGAHTGPQSYHYHVEPVAWSNDDDKLIAVMADGFFLYGRRDYPSDDYPTDLDASGGHFGPTPHNPDGEYHYHCQNELYLNTFYLLFPGDFQGTPSSISQ